MTENAANQNHEPETHPTAARRAWGWARRHSSSLLLLGVVLFLGMAQWPMIKGIVANTIGAPIPADHIAWRTDYKAALEESAKTGKPVLLDFSASWCPPCQAMKREVWPDKEVGERVNQSFIPVTLDADSTASGDAAQRYDVNAIPDIIVTDSTGKVLNRAHYLSRGGMLSFLKESLAKQGM